MCCEDKTEQNEENDHKTNTMKGLDNLGNTCYMNSSLQALFATKKFKEYLLSSECSKPLHQSIQKLFSEMSAQNNTKSVEPKEFWKVFTKSKTQFHDRQQHDAQEFLRYIIDDIHEEVNDVKELRKKRTENEKVTDKKSAWSQFIKYMGDSFLVTIFVGQMRSTIKCSECQYKSRCWECFWDLSLPLPEKDEECDVCDCLKLYLADEMLDSDSMILCPKCNEKRKFCKKFKIEKMPPILMIQLMKFGNDGQKIHKNVNINEILDIEQNKYSLYAAVSHYGYSCSSGHYISHCKHGDKWYLFDDEDVTEVEDMDFKTLTDAYILFYQRSQ